MAILRAKRLCNLVLEGIHCNKEQQGPCDQSVTHHQDKTGIPDLVVTDVLNRACRYLCASKTWHYLWFR
jgi:hypothetical protein